MHSENNEKPKKKFKELFVKFWCTENGKMSIIRDVVIALILVIILLTALWAYTGQWGGAPMVAIESQSMMHENEPYGRLGTIDPGDMVLLVKIHSRSDIVTRGSEQYGALAKKDSNNYFYGDYGDVIVYHPYGLENRDQIIHRAMCWVEYNDDGTYTVAEYGIYNENSVNIPELGLRDWTHPTIRPDGTKITPHSGFITKGDNNDDADQASPVSNICTEPIKVEWISGKARQEIPWIGTINLFFNDLSSGTLFTSESTVGNVVNDAFDSIVCLIILIIVLISIPVSLDAYDYYKNNKKEKEKFHFNKDNNLKKTSKESNEDIETKIDEKFKN